MMIKRLIFSSLFFISSFITSFQALDLAGGSKKDSSGNTIRILFGDEGNKQKQQIFDSLKKEYETLQQQTQEAEEPLSKKIQEVRSFIDHLRKDSRASEFSTKKLNYLNTLEQVLLDTQDQKKHLLDIVKRHIEFWEKYFNQAKIKTVNDEKSIYSFQDMQQITKKIGAEEDQKARLVNKKEEEEKLMSREEYVVGVKKRDIAQIEKDIEELRKQTDSRNIKEQVDLHDLEKEVLTQEQALAQLKSDLHKHEADLYESRILVAQESLKSLKDSMSSMRNLIHIDASEKSKYETKLKDVRKEVTTKKDALIERKNAYIVEKNSLQEHLNVLSNRYNIALDDMRQIEDWDFKVDHVLQNHALYLVAFDQLKIEALDRFLQKNKIETTIEDAKLEQAQTFTESVKTLYNITQGFLSEKEELDKERVAFKELKETLQSDIKKIKDEVASVHAFIKDQHKIVNNIKKQQTEMKSLASKVSSANQKRYLEDMQVLAASLEKLESMKDVSLNLSELYTKLADIKEETLENVVFLLQELDLIGVWHRSTSAVTWEGIKNVMPNLAIFFKQVYLIFISYVQNFDVYNLAYGIASIDFSDIFLFLFLLFILFVFFVLFQALLPSLYTTLMSEDDSVVFYTINRLFAVIVRFTIVVYKSLFFWMVFLLLQFLYTLPIAIKLSFYIYSIAFWIYASRLLLMQFLYVNRQSNYTLLHKRLIERFSFIFSFFSVSTIVLLFFRKMFILVMVHQQSEFPNVLMRIYHVILFVSIVFSIDREEILQVFPSKSKLARKIAVIVQQYYYLFLMMFLGLLIMSDPYLGGYGSLIRFVIWNSLLTAVALVVLFILFRITRQYTDAIFYEEDPLAGGQVERFEHAQNWYVAYLVAIYSAFSFLMLMLGSSIWGYNITLQTIKRFFYYQLPLGVQVGEKITYLTVIDLSSMVLIVIGGVVVSYVVRRFILEKIFETQYVDLGVQNTVTIISRYIIIFVSIMLALAHVQLYSVISYIWLVGLVTFGWSFKDLFTDIVAYFFILVQRPLKLGDYVKLSDDTRGVVRKIGPRAVILRRKNAVNIVVPNSTVLKSSLYNWNYAGSYIGFNDISFSVPFGTDIKVVREILARVISQDPDVLKVPQPIIRLEDFSDKGYVFMVRGFLSSGNTLRQWDITSNIRIAIVEELSAVGIQIAAPSLKVLLAKNSTNIFDELKQ